MPLNKQAVLIDGIAPGTAVVTHAPQRVDDRGVGSERTSAGKRGKLTITRYGATDNGTGGIPVAEGTIAVYGMDLAQPNAGRPLGNSYATAQSAIQFPFLGDASATTFQTNIPYVAPNATYNGYNWIVEMAAFKLTGTFAVTTAGAVTGTSSVSAEFKVGDTIQLSTSTQILVTTVLTKASGTVFTVSPAPGTAMTGAVGINTAADRRIKTYIDSGSLSTTDPELYSVTSGATIDGVACALISFAVAPPKNVGPASGTNYLTTGQPINPNCVYFGTPTEIKPAGTYDYDVSGVRCSTVMWTVQALTNSKLTGVRIYLEPSFN